MTSVWRTCGVLVLIVASASAAAAQSGAPVRLSLDDALTRGQAAAPRLAEARARQEAAAAAVTAREALKRPDVTGSLSYQRTNHVDQFLIPQSDGTLKALFPDIPNNYRARADVSVPLYTGGQVDALIGSARADREAADADLKAASADVTLDIARAYWTFVTARESVKVVEQGVVRMDAYVSDVKSRVDAGMLPPNDLLSAQAQRARQNVALIQARNAAAVAQADLCRLVGLDLDSTIEPTSPLMATTGGAAELSSMAIGALGEEARAGRAEREALTKRAEAARASGEAAASVMKPRVSVTGGVEESRPNARVVPRVDEFRSSWEAGIGVSWHLFDGGKAKADRAAALAQATALERRRDDFDATLGVELRQRRGDLESARAALDASADAVAAATEARRVVTERFKAGVSTSTDVLEAETALLEAELERTRLATQLRISEARLRRAVGKD